MFSAAYSKQYSPWALGQSRTLGRALNLDTVKMRLNDKWIHHEYDDDLLAPEVCKRFALSEVLVSDTWGPRMLYDF